MTRPARAPCRLDVVRHESDGLRRVQISRDPAQRRAAGRKRRLHRGLLSWDLDRRLCPEATRRAVLLTFTIRDDEQHQVVDAMRRFWRQAREKWPGMRYFCWLELTKRGQMHYHAWWLNPPNAKRVHLASWVQHTWRLGYSKVAWPRDRWSEAYMTQYVLGYVKKMGAKAYQQQYADLPRGIKTYMTQRTDIPVTELVKHLDGQVWAYEGETSIRVDADDGGPGRWEYVGPQLRYVADREHQVPAGGYCSAVDHARRRKRPRWHLPPPAPPLLKNAVVDGQKKRRIE